MRESLRVLSQILNLADLEQTLLSTEIRQRREKTKKVPKLVDSMPRQHLKASKSSRVEPD